jgi:type IV pilus assembly protein PilN
VIKVNLLAVDRDRVKRKAGAKFQFGGIGGQKTTLASSLILVAAALLIVGWYMSLNKASAEVDRQIAEAQRETIRLQSIIKQVQQFEARRAQLQQRVTLIEQLRKGQTGPVHMLDVISHSLPDTMWLTDMKQTGNDILIDGQCMTLTSLSDFVSGLASSGIFAGPVEIVDSQAQPPTPTTTEVIKFTVKAHPLSTSVS